jgi:L-asparaginase
MGDMKREDTIRILITGGTIDKEYDPLTGELTFAKSHLSNMLNQVRCKVRVVLEEVMLKDSLQMIPYAFGASDALFNLGFAFSAVQALQQGVYITMNGKIFTWDNVRKNKESSEFEELTY